MWKDTEYFRNKGGEWGGWQRGPQPHAGLTPAPGAELHRCAVFCLLQIGVEIYDTEMVLVDRTLTDICFENAVLLCAPRRAGPRVPACPRIPPRPHNPQIPACPRVPASPHLRALASLHPHVPGGSPAVPPPPGSRGGRGPGAACAR